MLSKTKLNKIEFLISKDLNDSYISHTESILLNNVLKEFEDMKEKIRNPSKNKYGRCNNIIHINSNIK